MKKSISTRMWFAGVLFSLLTTTIHGAEPTSVPAWLYNHLLDATISGNLESYDAGLRGKPDHVIYDPPKGEFQVMSSWHEYGIGAGEDIGVITEVEPVTWTATWTTPVVSNFIALRGAYPNQPQPDTAWKIELHRDGQWVEHDRGVGGWYDNGMYRWQVPMADGVTFDGFRVSLFSKDDKTPLNSVHFRGEKGTSWVVASKPDMDARIQVSARRVRLGESIDIEGIALDGAIEQWEWDFGDGTTASGAKTSHSYTAPGTYTLRLEFATDMHRGQLAKAIEVGSPVASHISPLTQTIYVGDSVDFNGGDSIGAISEYVWDFGDGSTGSGPQMSHTFTRSGVMDVTLTTQFDTFTDRSFARIRVLEAGAKNLPQVLLDSDQKNEQDDQYFLGYAIFSELELLGINSVHHGGGQEAINYAEILHVIDLAKESGAPDERLPTVYHGANDPLDIPESRKWFDTMPIATAAAEAILAVARGASPDNPPWIVPVGPGTNVASAILMAREQGLVLADRIRIMWLGGSDNAITHEFNGNNDPWSLYVIGQSGIETWIMPAPVGARVRIDKRSEADWYADNPLGRYLEKITPANNKPLFDPAVLGVIIDVHQKLGWTKEVEEVRVEGPSEDYKWYRTDKPSTVKVIREIDQAAIKKDIFETLKGNPTPLR